MSPNMSMVDRADLAHIFDMKIVDKPGIYLGADMDFSKKKDDLFSGIFSKFQKKLAGWKTALLTFAGRVTLIKHALLAISLYLLSVFKAPSYFFKRVQSLVTKFLWKPSTQKGICWKKWADLCKPMGLGGLGFRDLKAMNQSLLAKTAWCIYKQPQSLLSQVLLGKYCPNQDFWRCSASAHSSWGWKGIIWGKQLLKDRVKWKIGDGCQVDMFTEHWIPNYPNPYMAPNSHRVAANLKVCHLFNPITKKWREPLLRSLFPSHIVADIQSIHIPAVAQPDSRIWPFTRSGEYSVKTGYFQCSLGGISSHSCPGFSAWPKFWALK